MPPTTTRDRDFSGRIFTVSAGLVGVCVTVIGLFNSFRNTGKVQSVADNLIAVDATVFLGACLSAYLALRTVDEARWRRMERYADVLFLLGISGMVLIGGLIAYDFI
jgi:hypothetical protein